MTITLPDGYNGATATFHAEPIERDGALLKLRCADPGKAGCVRWVRETDYEKALNEPR